jgi:hypothetical protein
MHVLIYCPPACLLQGSALVRAATRQISQVQDIPGLLDALSEWTSSMDIIAVAAAMKRLTLINCSPEQKRELARTLGNLAKSRLDITSSKDLDAAAQLLHYCAQLQYYDGELIAPCLSAIVRWRNLGTGQSLSTALYALGAISLARRGKIPGMSSSELQEPAQDLLRSACILITDPLQKVEIRQIEQTVVSASIMHISPSNAECQAMLDVFLSSVRNNSAYDVTKSAINIMRVCAVLGFLPSPEDLRGLFAAAMSQNVRGFTYGWATSSLIDYAYTALKIFAIEIPGGQQALLKYQQDYTMGCEVLLKALLLLPHSKVRASNVSSILRMAADIATAQATLLPRGLVCQYAPRLCELFNKVQGRFDVNPSVVLCEGIVSLNMRDLSPTVVKNCEFVARSLNHSTKGGPSMLQQLRSKHKASLWSSHCWLQEGGYKKQIFTPELLQHFKQCNDALPPFRTAKSAAAAAVST